MGSVEFYRNILCIFILSSSITLTMTSAGVNSFNKSKEDFIWFIKKATSNRKSDAHSELYQALLKMFVDADTNFDGLVSPSLSLWTKLPPFPEPTDTLLQIQSSTNLMRREIWPGRRCSTPWISRAPE